MDLYEARAFSRDNLQDMFYVGIVKSAESWFPFCVVSDPQGANVLDTLPLSRSHQSLLEVLDDYAGQIPQIEQTFVHLMTGREIQDLMRDYGLKHVTVIPSTTDQAGCSCGCGCA